METQHSARPIDGTQHSEAPRLPRFWAIVRRRWPILVIVPLLALGLAAWTYKHAARTYTASGEATITDISPDTGNPQGYANYYRDLASEAASDDFTRIVPGSMFAQNVSKRLKEKGIDDPVLGTLSATRVYRALTVTATTSDPNRSVQIAQAAMDELAANGPSYLPNRPVQLTIINEPTGASASSLKRGVLAAGTLFAGILAAAAVALLVELFDTRLHDRQETEDFLRVPVVAEIPRRREPA